MEKLKWCIKRTPENYKEVNEWANNYAEKNTQSIKFEDDRMWVHFDGIEVHSQLYIKKDFHEITLDEFRLLTNPERYCYYSFRFSDSFFGLKLYAKGTEPTRKERESNKTEFPVVSEPVFNELQRMWKEREEPTTVYSKMCAELSGLVKKMQDAMAQGNIISESDEKRAKELDSELKKIDSSIGRFSDRQTGNYTPTKLKFMESDSTDFTSAFRESVKKIAAFGVPTDQISKIRIPAEIELSKQQNFIHQLKHELRILKKGMKQIQKTIDKFEGKQF